MKPTPPPAPLAIPAERDGLFIEFDDVFWDAIAHDAELWERLFEIAPALARYYRLPRLERGPFQPPVARKHRAEATAIVDELSRQ